MSEQPSARTRVGKRAGAIGMICNLLLFVAKLCVGVLTGSVAITADAFNNLSDASSSLMTFLGFRLAQRPADKDHPYGHARYEYLAGLGVAVLIMLIGMELVRSSFEKILNPAPVLFDSVTLWVLLGAIATKALLFWYFKTQGKKISSATLLATAKDSLNDVLVTTVVLICGWTRLPIDGYVGLLVAAFILYSGIRVAGETISPLLGKQADPRLVEQISELVLAQEKIIGIHDLLIHDYGYGQSFASVHVEISAEEDALFCHDIIDEIECAALEQLGVHLVIHYDPVLINDAEWITLRQTVEEVIGNIDPNLSMHDFRLVKGAKQTKMVFDLAVPYEQQADYHQLKETIDQALYKRGNYYPTVIRFDQK